MKDLLRLLIAGAVSGIVCAGAFARDQKDRRKPPPKKDLTKVVVKEKRNPPKDSKNVK